MQKKLPTPISFLLGFVIGMYSLIAIAILSIELSGISLWRLATFVFLVLIVLGIVYGIGYRLMARLGRPVNSYGRLTQLYILASIVTVLLSHLIISLQLTLVLQLMLGGLVVCLLYALGDLELENAQSLYFILEEEETEKTA